MILKDTRKAMGDLERQVGEAKGKGEAVGECWAVRINSGKFGVKWEKTKAVLEEGGVDIIVVRPAEEEEKGPGKEEKASRGKRAGDDLAGREKRVKGAEGGAGKGAKQGGLDEWLK